MPNQLPIRVANHLRRRIGRMRYNFYITKKSATNLFRLKYYRSMLLPKYCLPEVTLSSLGVNEIGTQPLIMDEICMPPYYSYSYPDNPFKQWANKHDDMGPLLAIISVLKPKIILELGTAHGNTIANICQQNPDVNVYTVNAPAEEQTGEVTTFNLSLDEIGIVYRKHNFAERVRQIYQNTLHLDLSDYFDKPMVDIAIIDACHDEIYVLNDFLKVEPYITSGGVILLHDTHPTMEHHLIGSYTACMKLRAKGYDIRHLDGTWWGIWTKGNS